MRYDDYGNFAFGYWGRITTPNSSLLLWGAGRNQEGKFNTVGDDPRDTWAIKQGMSLFHKQFVPKVLKNEGNKYRWSKKYFEGEK